MSSVIPIFYHTLWPKALIHKVDPPIEILHIFRLQEKGQIGLLIAQDLLTSCFKLFWIFLLQSLNEMKAFVAFLSASSSALTSTCNESFTDSIENLWMTSLFVSLERKTLKMQLEIFEPGTESVNDLTFIFMRGLDSLLSRGYYSHCSE